MIRRDPPNDLTKTLGCMAWLVVSVGLWILLVVALQHAAGLLWG